MSSVWKKYAVAVFALLMFTGVRNSVAAIEPDNEAKWYVSPLIGWHDFEGDEWVDDSVVIGARVGYDWTEWLTLEGCMRFMPSVDGQDFGYQIEDTTGDRVMDINPNYAPYIPASERTEGNVVTLNKLEAYTGETSTWGMGLSADALYHFTRWERLDPFVSLGVGFNFYGEDINDDPAIFYGSAGYGVMYHFNDEWGARVDGRYYFSPNETENNSSLDAGVVWYWDANVPYKMLATGGPQDSDGDGLLDAEELELGTNPYDPDTDKDDLKDGPEVKTYKTDPLNKDTDMDMLTDGQEVLKYATDPIKADTDDGGVIDGHEVLEDGTNPLEKSDDLMLFTLYIQFDYDKSEVKPQYHNQIDVIAKVMSRHPGSTATVEGHADQTKKSTERHNKKLSQERAQSVANYISKIPGRSVSKDRLSAVGYGYSRPKVKPDLINGNPENRRVDVYIKGANGDRGEALPEAPSAPAPEKPENK